MLCHSYVGFPNCISGLILDRPAFIFFKLVSLEQVLSNEYWEADELSKKINIKYT